MVHYYLVWFYTLGNVSLRVISALAIPRAKTDKVGTYLANIGKNNHDVIEKATKRNPPPLSKDLELGSGVKCPLPPPRTAASTDAETPSPYPLIGSCAVSCQVCATYFFLQIFRFSEIPWASSSAAASDQFGDSYGRSKTPNTTSKVIFGCF